MNLSLDVTLIENHHKGVVYHIALKPYSHVVLSLEPELDKKVQLDKKNKQCSCIFLFQHLHYCSNQERRLFLSVT